VSVRTWNWVKGIRLILFSNNAFKELLGQYLNNISFYKLLLQHFRQIKKKIFIDMLLLRFYSVVKKCIFNLNYWLIVSKTLKVICIDFVHLFEQFSVNVSYSEFSILNILGMLRQKKQFSISIQAAAKGFSRVKKFSKSLNLFVPHFID